MQRPRDTVNTRVCARRSSSSWHCEEFILILKEPQSRKRKSAGDISTNMPTTLAVAAARMQWKELVARFSQRVAHTLTRSLRSTRIKRIGNWALPEYCTCSDTLVKQRVPRKRRPFASSYCGTGARSPFYSIRQNVSAYTEAKLKEHADSRTISPNRKKAVLPSYLMVVMQELNFPVSVDWNSIDLALNIVAALRAYLL